MTMVGGLGMASLLGSLRQLLAAGESRHLPVGAGGPLAPAEVDRPRIPRDRARWSFANGNIIFRGGSRTPIDPQSPEGRTIEGILERQRADREANARQRAHVAALRQSAIPRAVLEGRAGIEAIRLGPGLTVDDLFKQRTSR